jgi:hypothetical protein
VFYENCRHANYCSGRITVFPVSPRVPEGTKHSDIGLLYKKGTNTYKNPFNQI